MSTLTLQDVLEMPLERREFIAGELFVPPAPEPLHQDVAGELFLEIKLYLRQHGGGKVFFAPLDVVIDGATSQPDLIFVAANQLEIIEEKRIVGAPKWLVEVVSPISHKRDFETKKTHHLENGVEEYWVISLEGRVVWIFTPDNLEGEVFGRGRVSPRCLPDLNLELAKLFAAV